MARLEDRNEFQGYSGDLLRLLRDEGAKIGTKVKIVKEQEAYTGYVMPRPLVGDRDHLVIKLGNGYNIGLKIDGSIRLEVIGEGLKPSFATPPIPTRKESLKRISILSTGGTIASRVDYRTGAVEPTLDAESLYCVLPELADIAQIDSEILFNIFSEDMASNHWSELAKHIARNIERGASGIVVAHGTDTLGFTSAAMSFALRKLPVPVVLVGAQRSSDRPSSDAASNLLAAVNVAANGPFAEVVAMMHEWMADDHIAIHRGTKVRKCHTSRRDAFKSVNEKPLGRVNSQTGQITMFTEDFQKRDLARRLEVKPSFDPTVVLLKFFPGMSRRIVDSLVDQGCRGLILEGTGLGHISESLLESVNNAVQKDVIVAMTSQCIWGRVNLNVYSKGRDLLKIGVIPLGDMLAETALVKLMWTLGQTEDPLEVKETMLTNIVGEVNSRSYVRGASEWELVNLGT